MTLTKISSLLGIAQRAGFVVSGSNLVLREVARAKGQRAKSWLVLAAADALTPTGEDVIYSCLRRGVLVARIPLTMEEMGQAIGKNHRSYVMIKDSGIARRILALLEEMEVQPLDQSKNI